MANKKSRDDNNAERRGYQKKFKGFLEAIIAGLAG